jgi:RNA polymerase sigma-70 factor, ECF subfamily
VTSGFPVAPVTAKPESRPSVAEPQAFADDVLTDELLLARIAGGDQKALAFLFQRYCRLLRGVATRVLRDASEAEDLVQDLFLFFQRRSAIFDSSKSSGRSWIVQMAYHRAISRRRYLVTRNFYTHQEIGGIADWMVGTTTTENDYSEEYVFGRNGLEQIMETLSGDQRETLRLHFFEGYTLLEISEIMQQPHGNVRNHYYRGLAQLRKQMCGSKVQVVQQTGK